jgi:hypothetical protein
LLDRRQAATDVPIERRSGVARRATAERRSGEERRTGLERRANWRAALHIRST